MKLYLFALTLFFSCSAGFAQTKSSNYVKIYDARGRRIVFEPVKKPVIQLTNGMVNICATDKNGNMLQLNRLDLRNPRTQKTVLKEARLVYIDTKSNKSYTAKAAEWKNPVTWQCKTCTTNDKLTVTIKEKLFINHTYYTVEAGFENIIPGPLHLTTDKTNNRK